MKPIRAAVILSEDALADMGPEVDPYVRKKAAHNIAGFIMDNWAHIPLKMARIPDPADHTTRFICDVFLATPEEYNDSRRRERDRPMPFNWFADEMHNYKPKPPLGELKPPEPLKEWFDAVEKANPFLLGRGNGKTGALLEALLNPEPAEKDVTPVMVSVEAEELERLRDVERKYNKLLEKLMAKANKNLEAQHAVQELIPIESGAEAHTA